MYTGQTLLLKVVKIVVVNCCCQKLLLLNCINRCKKMKPRRIETLLPLMIELVITQMTLVYVFVYLTIEIFLAFFNEIFKIQAVTKIPVVRMRNCGSHETLYAHTNVKHSKINKSRKKVTFEPPWKWRKKDSKMLISFKWTVFVRMYWKARWGKAEINYVKDQKMPFFQSKICHKSDLSVVKTLT